MKNKILNYFAVTMLGIVSISACGDSNEITPALPEEISIEIHMDGQDYTFNSVETAVIFVKSGAYQKWVYYVENVQAKARTKTACGSNGVCVTCNVQYAIDGSQYLARCTYSDGRKPTYHII
jgi:hypothetical protein